MPQSGGGTFSKVSADRYQSRLEQEDEPDFDGGQVDHFGAKDATGEPQDDDVDATGEQQDDDEC